MFKKLRQIMTEPQMIIDNSNMVINPIGIEGAKDRGPNEDEYNKQYNNALKTLKRYKGGA